DNDATIEDPDEAGAFEDWVELYNPGTTSVDLSGFYLTDDATDPTQWQFPAGSTIDAGGYLIIWADGDTDQGDDHAAFKLSAGGESVLLYNVDGTTLVDSVTFGEQTTDVSYGRFPDGSSTLTVLSAATPGASNTNDATPDNVAPNAGAGGPYSGNVGDTIILSGATSTDSDGTIASYAWDLDNDGQYDDAVTATTTFNATATGTFTIGLQVTDDDGATSTDTATVTVSAVAAAAGLVVVQSDDTTTVSDSGANDVIRISLASQPTADVTVTITSSDTGEVTVNTGTLIFTTSNWDTAQAVTAAGVADNVVDGTQSTGIVLSVSSADTDYNSLSNITITATSTDTDTDTVANVDPVADAGGPYTGTESGTVTLTGVASTDSDGTIASYAWDLDNDGQYDDATGVTATFNAIATGTFTVGLQVTDDDGATSTDTATVNVVAVIAPGLVVTQSDGSTIVNESSLTDTISVSLSTQPTADVTVDVISADSDEASVSPSQLTFTPDNWDIPQTVTISSSIDGINDGAQSTQVSFDASSTDASYASVASVEVSVTTRDSDFSNTATRIFAPDVLTSLHVIPGDSIPTAILFRAVADAVISVFAVGTTSVGQTIRVVDESVLQIDTFSSGVTTATVTSGGLYAIIFEPHTDNRTYTVQSTAGSDAFTPTSPNNFLQPTDANGDARTSALDALVIINQISRMQNAEGEELPTAFMYDVNRDGNTTALDALMVINQLARQTDAAGEGEQFQSADLVAPLLSNPLATPTLDTSDNISDNDNDQWTEYPLDEALTDTDSFAVASEAAFATQSNAVSELVDESESNLTDDDLDLLAEDLHHVLSMQESSS
ncbi:MAG: PKD domain-containing protein, partial [Rubripirellula sp.]